MEGVQMAKYVYPAIFTKEEDALYSVRYPVLLKEK